jgi:GR25 family glycosyltransferase involved in LPS biosynthesis
MNKFVINLNRFDERMKYFDDTYTRWIATDWKDLQADDPIFNKMISYHNIDPNQHKAKCGCFLSHINLWKHIIDNKIDNVIVVEDDAEQVNHIEDISSDTFLYLGGYFTKQMSKGEVTPPDLQEGINSIPEGYKVLMTLSYYIPTWKIAEQLYNEIVSKKRYRAIDVMLNDISLSRAVYYPSIYVERDLVSTIRFKKTKHPTEYYQYSKKKDIFKIAIPSYNRCDKLKAYTLTYLQQHNIQKKDIFIFVRPDDPVIDEYRTLLLEGYNVKEYNVKGIGMTHNIITDHFKSGEYIVEIDDDLKEIIDNKRRPILNLDNTIRRIIDKMIDVGASYSGLYQVDNPMFMSQCEEYTTDLRYMLGLFRVRRICKDIKLHTNYAEDFENCCAYYKRDGKILKCNHLAGRTKNYSPGGCDGDGRNIETELQDKQRVKDLYPEYCTLFQRKNKRWDLRLKHKIT